LFPIPVHYDCPFCKVASGEGDHITYPSDIVYQDDHTTAFISPKWWVNNHGYVIIIPNRHYQDIFDLPPDITSCIHSTAQKISRAFVELYNCDGISTRQHNGAYPMQEVFHYHFHVFPRYFNDQLYSLDDQPFRTTPEERLPYAEKLRAYFEIQ
jgi:histidine triad (HIT) family protein